MTNLFADTEETSSTHNSSDSLNNTPKPAHSFKWMFATNHLNLMMILAIGMLPEPERLGKKYYVDSLNIHEGWIPLFSKKIPTDILNYGISEDPDLLKPCIAEITLQSPTIQSITKLPALINNSWHLLNTQHDDFSQVECLLVPAPLPLTMITKVLFRSKEERKEFISRINEVQNVDFTFNQGVMANQFRPNKRKTVSDSLTVANLRTLNSNSEVASLLTPLASPEQPTKKHYGLANSISAVIAYLSILANSNDKALATLQNLRGSTGSATEVLLPLDSILVDFCDWCRQGGNDNAVSITNDTFLRIIATLINNKDNTQFASPKDIIIAELTDIAQHTDASMQFIEDLKNLVSFPDETVDSLLKRYGRPLQRSIILLFNKESFDDLIIIDKSWVTELDIVMSSILFGITQGWQALSVEKKTYAGMDNFASKMMSHLTHNLTLLGASSPVHELPKPVREVMLSRNWTKAQTEAATTLAKYQQWDCVETTITLPPHAFLTSKNAKVCVSIKGDDYKIDTRVNQPEFLANMLTLIYLPADQEKMMRNKLGKLMTPTTS